MDTPLLVVIIFCPTSLLVLLILIDWLQSIKNRIITRLQYLLQNNKVTSKDIPSSPFDMPQGSLHHRPSPYRHLGAYIALRHFTLFAYFFEVAANIDILKNFRHYPPPRALPPSCILFIVARQKCIIYTRGYGFELKLHFFISIFFHGQLRCSGCSCFFVLL